MRHAQSLAQLGQKSLLLGAAVAIGITHADGHFIRQLPQLRIAQQRHCRLQAHAAQQHILVQAG